ncbi:hypothetical protein ACFLW2_03720 [Chloroflexota bacterium]
MTTLDTIGVEPKVLEILGEDPTLPYSMIGDQVGVTRERVRQIAQRNGYPPRKGILRLKTCPVCGKTFNTKNLYCSPACGNQARRKRIVINCHQCGKPIERTPGNMRSKNGRYFCNRVCFGRWTGKNHSPTTRERRPIMGDFEHEIGSIDEFPLKGRTPSPEVMEIYNTLLQLDENELIKVKNSKRDELRKLGTAIKRKASRQGINVASAIKDDNGDSLLFLMRVAEDN